MFLGHYLLNVLGILFGSETKKSLSTKGLEWKLNLEWNLEYRDLAHWLRVGIFKSLTLFT